MAKKRDRQPTVRVQQNPVTHKLEVTVLDPVQLALDKIVVYIDGRMLGLTTTAERYNLARRLIERIGQMIPHQGEGSDARVA